LECDLALLQEIRMHASKKRAGHTVNQLIAAVRKMRVNSTSYAESALDDGTYPLAEARELLEAEGADILGEGAYSLAVAHRNPKKVIKITLSTVDGYHDYVEFVKSNKRRLPPQVSKHLPKLYGSTMHGEVRVTVVERLEPNDGYEQSASYERLKTILNERRTEGVRMDVHQGNVMMRGRVPVIIDPWAHFD
jgi:hypothetical protein